MPNKPLPTNQGAVYRLKENYVADLLAGFYNTPSFDEWYQAIGQFIDDAALQTSDPAKHKSICGDLSGKEKLRSEYVLEHPEYKGMEGLDKLQEMLEDRLKS